MAGRGPAPSGRRSRANDQRRDEAQVVVIEGDDELRGPDLPEGYDWPSATRSWWMTWRRSPLAQTFTDTDWDYLVDTARLHAEFWLGDLKLASEVRLRVAQFGATPADRARLKVAIGNPTTSTPATPETRRANTNRRSRLMSVVTDGATG